MAAEHVVSAPDASCLPVHVFPGGQGVHTWLSLAPLAPEIVYSQEVSCGVVQTSSPPEPFMSVVMVHLSPVVNCTDPEFAAIVIQRFSSTSPPDAFKAENSLHFPFLGHQLKPMHDAVASPLASAVPLVATHDSWHSANVLHLVR